MPDTTLRRTPALIAQARALHAVGFSLDAIAARLNTSRPTIRKCLGGAPVTERAFLIPEQIARIGELRAMGWGAKRIAADVGCARSTAAYHIEEFDRQAARQPAQQRVAASATHREGGPSPGAPALAPNSMEASLIMRGMRPEVAAATARAWRDRHARNDARSRRTGDGSRHVVAKEG